MRSETPTHKRLATRRILDLRSFAERSGCHLYRFGQLMVITDPVHRLMAVVVHRPSGKQFAAATVWDEARMLMRARWTGPLPRVGDHIRSRANNARFAFRVDEDPRITNAIAHTHDATQETELDLEVVRVNLPLPEGAPVIFGRWDVTRINTGWVVTA